jgi:hypothetical protein
MPYKKSYSKKSRYSKYSKYGNTAYTVSKRALQIALMTKKLLNVEYKIIDTQLSLAAISTTANILQLTNIAQGTSDITREGNQIKISSIQFKYYMEINASTTATALRFILVQDKQTNGAIYTPGDLLEDASPTDVIVSPNNLGNKFRFRILYNKVHTLSQNGSRMQYKEFYKKVELPIRYDGNAGTIADVNTNSLSMFIVSDEATNTPIIDMFVRLRFIDN